jgi:peptide/nickel transport system substrate-binding protein
MKNVTFQIIKDPSARVAAIQSGQVDLTLNVPVREADRFKKDANFKAELDPIQRVIIIQARGDLAFADKNVRLAAHHAIDKKALSQAFYGGTAVPLSVVAPPDTPGYVEGYTFAYDVELAKKLLADLGFGASKPVQIKMRFSDAFPGDAIWRGYRADGRRRH